MIIKITQTASNIKQEYDISGKDFFFQGKAGSFSRYQSIELSNDDDTLRGVFIEADRINYIPFRYLFGKPNRTRKFDLYKNDTKYGRMLYSKHGLFKSCYIIALDNKEKLHCYHRTIKSFDYVSIYRGNTQIALIETYLSVNDFKYTHKLYLLDKYKILAETLSLFVLYYAGFNFAQRFHMSKGSTSGYSWSFSGYNNKYDPKWRETNFPEENFFGRTSLFN